MAKVLFAVICISGLLAVPASAAQKVVAPKVSTPVVKDGGGSPDQPAKETKIGGEDGVQPQSGPPKPPPGINGPSKKRAGQPTGPNGQGAAGGPSIGQAANRTTKLKSNLTKKLEDTNNSVVDKMRRTKKAKSDVKDAHDRYANEVVQNPKGRTAPPGPGLLDNATGFNPGGPSAMGTPTMSAPRGGNIIK